MKQPVYILGHKNPDPDSICAAIAYADFKRQMGSHYYIPARCGNTNPRIDTILHLFDTPPPLLIQDLRPRIQDIMSKPIVATESFTCAQALELMDAHDLRALPVVDQEGSLLGMISIFALGEHFIPNFKNLSQTRYLHTTTIEAITQTLKAQSLYLENSTIVEDLYIRVAAMDDQSLGTLVQNQDIASEKTIMIVGDRKDIQEKAIKMQVRLLILSAESSLSASLLDLAKKKGVSIIVSPYDSATTTFILKSANLIAPLIDKACTVFEKDELLSTIKKRIASDNASLYCVCEDKKLIGVFTKSDLLKPIPTKLILVDHNELSQAVDGAGEVNILEIIDHHRLGNMPTEQPILFHNEPIGSTCSIIADMFQKNGLTPSKNIAGLMLSGLITDTYLLKSPTATPKDAQILEWLESISKVSAKDIFEKILSTGSIILSSPAAEVIVADCKIYEENGLRFSAAQIEECGFENFWNNVDNLTKALKDYHKKEGLFVSVLLITDINKQDSLMLVVGSSHFISKITYAKTAVETIFEMPKIVSRKKQLVPYLTQVLKQM